MESYIAVYWLHEAGSRGSSSRIATATLASQNSVVQLYIIGVHAVVCITRNLEFGPSWYETAYLSGFSSALGHISV